MSKRVLCKFFANGTCFKGECCDFSHDWKDQANNICIFYQKGKCTYGSRCRYEHVKLSHFRSSAPSSSSASSLLYSRSHMASSSVQATHPSSAALNGHTKPELSSQAQHSNTSKPLHPPSNSAWMLNDETYKLPDNMNALHPASASLADQPICSFAAAGSCLHGESCPLIHGDLCSTCGKHCLHPYRPAEREEHLKACEEYSKHLEALRRSQEIECCVCLECVLSKPVLSERQFGLLSECDHPFCISCIRNWRRNSPASGMDVNTALRACPVCRKHSHFVIPSVVWYSSQEEKQEIVDSYKERLKTIDCKHFDFGNGACPFGTSCFYRHTYKPNASRRRPRTYRPQRYRPTMPEGFMDEDELMDFAARLLMEEELENLEDEDAYGLLDHLDDEDAYGLDDEDTYDLREQLDDENPDGLLEMAFMLMHMGINDSSTDDED